MMRPTMIRVRRLTCRARVTERRACMFTPEGLADALKHSRRKLTSIRPESRESNVARVHAILDARPASAPQPVFSPVGLSDVFFERGPKPPTRRLPELTRWQAIRRLFNQEWLPPGPEDRKLRISAAFISTLMNLFFFAMLLWLMYWKFMMPPRPEMDESIRVQMSGAGAPEEEGGGAPERAGDIEVASDQSRSAQSAVDAPASESANATAPEMVQENIEATSVPVTQATVPTHSTVAPPIQHIEQPAESQPIVASKPTQAVTEYRVPDIKPMPLPAQRPVELKAETLPELATLPMPAEPEPAAPRVSMPNVRIAPNTQAPKGMQASDLTGAVKALPNPTPSNGSAAGQADSSDKAQASTTTGAQNAATNAAPTAAAGNKQGVAANAQGAGAATSPKQGSVPTPIRGDDWGDAKKNVAGTPKGGSRGNGKANGTGNNTAGIFNPDGSIRLPDQFKAKPPDPYKEGSWMKRPGIVVQDTVFNKYWRPPGTLLEDWVRRGIKAISIPIPGTNMVLNCQISLLQLGGGCIPGSGKNGPKDNPATARPPPDIPFKRELFEDQSVLGPPKTDQAKKPANDEWSTKPASSP